MKINKIILSSTAIFIFSFLIYILTSAPDLTFTDSGELAAVCSTLGIAHPTGYPLFTLLGYLWIKLSFFGTNIYSLNIFAGFVTACSVAVLFNTVLLVLNYLNTIPLRRKLINPKIQEVKKSKKQISSNIKTTEAKNPNENTLLLISISIALLYAFARTIWAQAVAIEVYSLHLLMMNLVLYFFIKAIICEPSRKVNLLIASLMLGLSFSNHMTTILLLPMIFVLYFWNPVKNKKNSNDNDTELMKKLKFFLVLTIPFLIGLSVYLYMPFRASGFPEFNWGWVSRSFEKFWYHFSGKQYQVWMFSDSTVWKENLLKFFEMLPNETAWLGFIPLLIGFYASYKKSKMIFYGLLIMIISCISYAANYSIHDIDSYFVTAFVGFIIFIAIGLWQLTRLKPKIYYSFFLLPLIAMTINYSYNDRSDDVLVPEYTKMVFSKLEPNAIVLSSQWDFWLSAAWYKQRVEGFRNDVVIIDKELLRRTWYLEQIKRWYQQQINICKKEIDDYLIDLELFESGEDYNPSSIQTKYINLLESFVSKNYDNHPIYITLDVLETEPDAFQGYEKIACGFAFKLLLDKTPQKVKASDINITLFVQSLKNNEGHLVDGIKTNAAISLVNLGRYALMNGDKIEAQIAFEKAYRIDSKNQFVVEAIKNFNNIKFED